MKFLLVHDFGTTALKAALFTEDGALLASASVEYPTYRIPGNGAEQDPEDWWNAFISANRQLLAGRNAEDVLCVSFDGTYPNCLCVDSSNRPLHRSLIWQVGRAVEEAETLTAIFPPERLARIPGHKLSQDRALCKLVWVRNHQPDVYAAAAKMLPSVVIYIILRLTGRAICDDDMGKSTAMLKSDQKHWSDEILSLADIPKSILPELHARTDIVGTVPEELADECALSAGTKLVIGTCDNLCADLGAGMIHPGDAYLNLGTSANITVLNADGKRFGMAGHSIHRLFFEMDDRQSLYTGTYGGRADRNGCIFTRQQSLSEVPVESHGVVFHPYLAGARSTLNHPNAIGSFAGIPLTTARQDLMRSIIEGIGMNLCLILNELKAQGNVIPRLNVVGGMAKSRVFLQIFADIFGTDLIRLGSSGLSAATGAAVLGGIAVGIYPDETAVDRFLIQKEPFHPDVSSHTFYVQRLKLFRQLYDANEPLYRSLRLSWQKAVKKLPAHTKIRAGKTSSEDCGARGGT